MAKKVKMNQVAVEEYAALRGIDVDSKDMEGAVKAIEEWVVAEDKKQKKDNQGYYCNTCGSGKTTRTVLHDDVFCWFCGADITADDNGGIEAYLKTKAASGDPVESAEPVEGAEPVEIVEPVEGKDPVEGKESAKGGPNKIGRYESEFEGDDTRALSARVDTIRRYESEMGIGAWEIGRELSQIFDGKRFVQGGHETFSDFCLSDLSYSLTWARKLMLTFKELKREQAGQLGVTRATMLAAAPKKVRGKLMKKATEMTTDQLKAKVVEAKKADRDPDAPVQGGRPPTSKFKGLLELDKKNVRWKDGGEPVVVAIDDFIGLEITKTKTGLSTQYVLLPSE